MQPTEKQLKKLEKLEKMVEPISASITLLDSIDEVEDKVEELKSNLESNLIDISSIMDSKFQEVSEKIDNIPQAKDYTEVLQVLKDKMEEPQEINVTLNII
jgi:hypothetical protein